MRGRKRRWWRQRDRWMLFVGRCARLANAQAPTPGAAASPKRMTSPNSYHCSSLEAGAKEFEA
eukprot:5273132-Pyramimonas_sp.AAC.1